MRSRRACFNGAAVMRRRRAPGTRRLIAARPPLQWGRRYETAERRPKLEQMVETAGLLQWGRRYETAERRRWRRRLPCSPKGFNGAAVMRRRRGPLWHARRDAHALLQ